MKRLTIGADACTETLALLDHDGMGGRSAG